jgi:hypothetical protein
VHAGLPDDLPPTDPLHQHASWTAERPESGWCRDKATLIPLTNEPFENWVTKRVTPGLLDETDNLLRHFSEKHL